MGKSNIGIVVDSEINEQARNLKINKSKICNDALTKAVQEQTGVQMSIDGSELNSVLEAAKAQSELAKVHEKQHNVGLKAISQKIAAFFRKDIKKARLILADVKSRGWTRETPEKNLKFWEEVLFCLETEFKDTPPATPTEKEVLL